MKLAGLYLFFPVIFTSIGVAIGYLSEDAWPVSGSLVTVAVFLAAVWFAWTVSLRLSERFWPEQPTA